MRQMLRTLQIAFTYIGTIVGAGFATGQEILQFFTQYGRLATLTIVFATGVFIWLGTKMMILAQRIGAESYEDFNRHLFGKNVGGIISLFTLAILIGVNSIMLAGAGAIFEEHLGLHYQTGLVLTVIGSYLLLKRGISGILQMNSIVVPLMLTLSLIIIFNTLDHPGAHHFLQLGTKRSAFAAGLSPFLYTAFNLGMSQAVLVPMARHTQNERPLIYGGILGGLGIGFMLMAAHFAMSAHMPGILKFEIPMGSIAFGLGALVQLVYLVLIFLEIFSTFVADIYGVTLQLAQRLPISSAFITPAVMLTCYVFSQFGFSSLLALFYPMFGALSLIWAVKLILAPMVPPGKSGAPPKTELLPASKPVPRSTRR
ncbi:YkvI family membrane protein [Paenibacillus zanthoxyli]|uniref:YkvI family membrane protein n=1 Tax=Paenibacillus zanthoxyli TaxID=369399 RepID=UPI000470CBF7|nr:membrane protein [Paenibacillus zanthoxyli]